MEYKCAYLVLGCNGRKDGPFTSCSSVENDILRMDPSLERIEELLYYLKSLGMFQKDLLNYNAIRNTLFKIQDRYYQNIKPIWSQEKFHLIEKFTLAHKECGLYLKIIFK